jgi:hypothetical protein
MPMCIKNGMAKALSEQAWEPQDLSLRWRGSTVLLRDTQKRSVTLHQESRCYELTFRRDLLDNNQRRLPSRLLSRQSAGTTDVSFFPYLLILPCL